MKDIKFDRKGFYVVLVAIIIVAAGLGIPYGIGLSTFTHVQKKGIISIPSGKFFKLSNQDYAPPGQIDVYLSSWYGCPIGAADSWMIYCSFSPFINMSEHSVTNQVPYANGTTVPGLLFYNFSFFDNATGKQVVFYPYYLYNMYLNRTADGFNNRTGGTPIPGNELVSTGLSELNESGFPSPIIGIITNITTVYPISGTTTPSAFLHPSSKPSKINTVMVITGSGGTWILNRYVIVPSSLTSYNPADMLSICMTLTNVKSAANNLTSTLSSAAAAPACL